MRNKKIRNNKKKLYFLIESKTLYNKPQKNIIGKVIGTVVANETPCMLCPKHKVVVFNGELYSLKNTRKKAK